MKNQNSWWNHLTTCLKNNNYDILNHEESLKSLLKSKIMSKKDFLEFKEKMEIKHKVTFVKIPVPNNKNCTKNQNNSKITTK